MNQLVLRSALFRRAAMHGRGAGAAPAATAATGAAHPVLLRALLVAGCVAAIAVAAWVGDPSGYVRADAALARLLRCMALIKGVLALAAVGAVAWRFGWPVSTPVAFSYALGSCVLAGSTMLIWQLSFIPLAAVLFHGAALTMLVIGWRER